MQAIKTAELFKRYKNITAVDALNLEIQQGELQSTAQNTVLNLFANLSRCIEDDYHKEFKSGRKMIDHKLRKMIQDKKQALGIREEQSYRLQYPLCQIAMGMLSKQ